MDHSYAQSSGSFLIRTLETLSRQNVYLYYWARKFLPLYLLIARVPHEKYFLILKKIPERTGIILDVGANDGLSVISIRLINKVNPILSLEPNLEHENRLRFLTKFIKNFSYLMVGAGAEEKKVTLCTPIYKGFPLTSFSREETDYYNLSDYGMFTNNYDESQLTLKKNTAQIVPIDTLNLDPMFVKIDVAGALELLVLKGMLDTIKRSQPVIMIERGNCKIQEINILLKNLNYHLVHPETAEPISEERVSNEPNLVFWPMSIVPLT